MNKTSNLVCALLCFVIAGALVLGWGFSGSAPTAESNPHFSVVYLPKENNILSQSTPTAQVIVLPYGGEIPSAVAQNTSPTAQTEWQFQGEPYLGNLEPQTVPTSDEILSSSPTPTNVMFEYIPSTEIDGLATPYYMPITPFPMVTPMPMETAISREYLLSYTLDEMWDSAESMGLTDRVSNCEGPPNPPYVTWEMASTAAGKQTADRDYTEIKMLSSIISGIVSQGGASFPTEGVQEEMVKSKLVEIYMQGNLHACLENNRPTLSGPGIQIFLDWLQNYIVTG